MGNEKKIRNTPRPPLVVQNKHFLNFFSRLSPAKRKRLVSSLVKPHVHTISEICHNFLKNNVPCNPSQLKKLKTCRKEIHNLASKRLPLYKKKTLMKSRRGGALLSVLLPLAFAAISSLIGGIAKKK